MEQTTPVNSKVQSAIFKAIDDVNAQLPEPQRMKKSGETALYGRNGHLDSLGLVNFVVAVEKHLLEDHGLKVKLDDEHALAHPTSPFISVEALGRYITSRLESR